MTQRTIYQDKQGLYVRMGKRKYRPDPQQNVSLMKGQVIETWDTSSRYRNTISVYPGGGGGWTVLTTSDPYVAPVPRGAVKTQQATQPDNQIEIRMNLNSGVQVLALVAEKAVKHGGQTLAAPLYLGLGTGGATQMTWDEWEQLVQKVNDAREEAPIHGIVAQLKAAVALEDELQDYIKEKGLA